MSCDQPVPGAGCTEGSPCAECGGGPLPAPVLPRCQGVSLVPGSYVHATVVVDANGCISLVTAGDAPAYPDPDCCAPVGGGPGGPGGAGARGPKGDPGAAATISVAPSVITGPTWALTNIGTPNAAIIQLTVPAGLGSGGGGGAGGSITIPPGVVTGDVCGLEFTQGWATGLPASIVTGLVYNRPAGAANALVGVTIGPANPANCDLALSIDVTALYSNIQGLINTAANALQLQIDGLTDAVAALDTRLDTAEANISSLTTATDALLVRGNGNYMWNGSSAPATIQLWEIGGGAPAATLGIPAGAYIQLPDSPLTGGQLYQVKMGGKIIHMYYAPGP